MASTENTPAITYVNARCHCSSNKFKIPFQTSKLPLHTDLCHCSSCRHSTGVMAVQSAPIDGKALSPDSADTPADLSGLSKYNVTPRLTHYFCTKCGAYMFYEFKDGDKSSWGVSTGVLEKTEGIVEVGYHTFVEDTLDGGIADHYRALNGIELPRYAANKGSATLPIGWKAKTIAEKDRKAIMASQEDLAFRCHCGTISLAVQRIKTATPGNMWEAPGKNEGDPIRFIAGHCVCNDCRLASGSLINTFVFPPHANVIDTRTSSPLVLTPGDPARPEGWTQYQSSEKVYREFCGKCGARAVYWQVEGHAAGVKGIAAGLLDEEAGLGSRAEDWIAWYGQVAQAGSANDKKMVEALTEGVKAATA